MPEDRSLSARVALVVGGGGHAEGWGVGKAVSARLAEAGAHVAVLDVSPEAAGSTASAVRARGGEALILPADVTRAEQLQAAVERCRRHFGRIDILVNNVALGAVGSVVDTAPEDWDRLMSVNLRGIYLACKYALPALIETGAGRVINISSLAALGYTGKPLAAYAASKAGLHGLSRDVAVHFATRGIRANTIVIGLIDTPLIRSHAAAIQPGGDVEAMMRARDAMVPTGRQGDAWDVAHLVWFLSTDMARFINGAEIVIDGGSSARSA